MTTTTMIELRTIVVAALRRFGCIIEPGEENLFQAAVPAGSPLRQILDVDDSVYIALRQYEEDRLAGLEPVRHLVAGSIYLERFIGALTEQGAVGDLTLPAAYTPPACEAVQTYVAEAVPDAAGCEVELDEVVLRRCVTFHFVVDLIATESSKSLVSVTFDFDGRRIVTNPEVVSLRDVTPAVVEISDAELKAAAGAVLESVRAEVSRQIEAYAEEHHGERSAARRRLRRQARTYLGGVDERSGLGGDGPLEDEREEIARDWDQRIRHADSQYRAEGAQVTLVSATRQLRPLARYTFRLPGGAAWGRLLEVLYDLTCGSFLLPLCHSCGFSVGKLTTGEGFCAHPLCESCAEVRPACGHRTCKACVCKCSSCPATTCRDCSYECSHDECLLAPGSSGLCDKHKKFCAQCEACVCGRHRQFCKSCQRTFCSLCLPDHQAKQAGCGHVLACGSKPITCRLCSNTLCPICAERCRQCGRYSCKEHTAHCRYCSSGLCDKHKAACAGCETVICGEHRLLCKHCRGTFCGRCYSDHGWQRVDCGHLIGCGSKHSLCRICKDTLCADCSGACRSCGHTVCGNHLVRCLGCWQWVCERCAGHRCEACDAQCCHEHSFLCKACGRHLCHEHAQWCAVCNRAMCESHVVRCRWCLNTLCPTHGRGGVDDVAVGIGCPVCEEGREAALLFCDSCNKLVPRKLITRHDGSDKLTCVECSLKCSGCAFWSSEFELGQCDACGMLLCDGCLENHAGECL